MKHKTYPQLWLKSKTSSPTNSKPRRLKHAQKKRLTKTTSGNTGQGSIRRPSERPVGALNALLRKVEQMEYNRLIGGPFHQIGPKTQKT